jgi:hypothetical protein
VSEYRSGANHLTRYIIMFFDRIYIQVHFLMSYCAINQLVDSSDL